jgi:hypothetical protein
MNAKNLLFFSQIIVYTIEKYFIYKKANMKLWVVYFQHENFVKTSLNKKRILMNCTFPS